MEGESEGFGSRQQTSHTFPLAFRKSSHNVNSTNFYNETLSYLLTRFSNDLKRQLCIRVCKAFDIAEIQLVQIAPTSI